MSSSSSHSRERQPLLAEDDSSDDASVKAVAPDREQQFKIASAMFCFFFAGIITTAIGALLIHLETYYAISNATTSLIFPFSIAGYIVGSTSMPLLVPRLGWRGISILTPAFHIISMLLLSLGPPFAVVLIGILFAGIGTGISDAGFCAWSSKMKRANVVQGFLHGSFSSGAVIGPVLVLGVVGEGVSTAGGRGWWTFYWVALALACIETLALGFAFRRDGVEAFGASKELATSTDHPKDSDDEGDNASSNTSKPMKATPLAFRIKLITICGLFYFCYIGVEACFSNWIIAYTLRVRHFPPNLAPFSSSLFWIGMSIGRLTLGPWTERLGVSKALTMYLLLSILCQLIFKFFTKHSPALSLLLLALNGYVLAPTYPSGIVLLAKNMHMHEAVGAVSAAASLGQIGGAAVPLGIGFMADRIGLGKLLDVVLGLSGAVLIIWWVFDRVVGR